MVVSRSVKVQMGLERKQEGRCQVHFGKEDVKHILTALFINQKLETGSFKEKWLNVNKETVYRKLHDH